MWRWYFGEKFRYIGVDINPSAKQFTAPWATIFVGDQSSAAFWDQVAKEVPEVDILLDDGGHTMEQQKVTFNLMFSHVKTDGIYITEDLATSFAHRFGGVPYQSRAHPDTFLEYSMLWINWLNGYFVDGDMRRNTPSSKLSDFERKFADSVASIHYYSQLVLVEKGKMGPPSTILSGKRKIPYAETPWDGKAYPLSLTLLDREFK